MKKLISIILVAVMVLSFAACDNSKKPPVETLPLDTETLKADWKNGTLVLPGDKTVTLPCTLGEFLGKSGAKINGTQVTEDTILESDESVSFYVSVEGANLKITIKNTTDEAISCTNAYVSKYSYNNTTEANRQVKFVGTLSPGVSRADVEEALEIPKDRTSEDEFYIYEGRNSKNRKVKLNIAFNSDGIVNSVSYEILY